MKFKCSHKALEWKEYRENRKLGKFPPDKFCLECEKSKALKSVINPK